MTSVLPVHLVLFRVFLRKSDKNRSERQKPYFSSRNKASKCTKKKLNTALVIINKDYPGPSLKSLEGVPTKQRGTPGNLFVIT